MTEENFTPLSEYPIMVVTGQRVTSDQAKEIIFRTDQFFTNVSPWLGGNNRLFIDRYQVLAGLKPMVDLKRYSSWLSHNNVKDEFARSIHCADAEAQQFSYDLRSKLKFVATDCPETRLASSCYIHGPMGWCQPDGRIAFMDTLGEVSTDDILTDWSNIAAAFPYLDLQVTLFGCEVYDGFLHAAFSIIVKDGKSTQTSPVVVTMKHRSFLERLDLDAIFNANVTDTETSGREQGLPISMVDEFAARVKAAVDQMIEHEDYAELKTRIADIALLAKEAKALARIG